MNAVKAQEMVVDFRKNPPPVPELIIDDVAVERVDEYRYVGTVLNNHLTFDRNVDTIHKKSVPYLLFTEIEKHRRGI